MAILTGTGIVQTDIELLCKQLAIPLPDDYIQFLKKYNGFWVDSSDGCELPFDKVDNGYISFDAFFGYQVNNEKFDLALANDEFLDELSFIEHAVIIGCDPGDNFFVLVTEGEQAGVYYWDRTCLHADDSKQDYTISGDDDYLHLYQCSENFSVFFEKILTLTVKNGMATSTGL
ncbi:SMI1/KNR4 family protein [Enterobacter asburiae]|nr:SMI1/KNR4 family protein [Enterobacter asburiae]